MKLTLFLCVLAGAACQLAASGVEQPEWGVFFSEQDAVGTLVVLDQRTDDARLLVFNQERAAKRFSPASTFKIPHTLFALDAGVLKDRSQVFKWDGVERSFAGHNRDQDLRSAMRYSALWVYQGFAQAIGDDKAQQYLQQLNYGNADITLDQGDYWVDGHLAISAYEQIAFLQQLYRNELPFSQEHQQLVKELIMLESGPHWILRAKTGWQGQYGWWVGWVEWPSGPVFFALNIDTPNRMADLAKREQITRTILRSLDALPALE
ncbi:class D beta-lactamase [Alkalimonas sp.]|uniref:class D beta-lactamase n=1 Tax=Alkalimonas sp. TaxID=1872453 RepID=UPI00263AFF04|nr:class D beta-lactamase [Alkalimonas sp.]MCC5827306.1 class D beta-lactamase [Alkalimonas sp.]